MRRKSRRILVLVLIGTALAGPLDLMAQDPMVISRLSDEPELDGNLFEPAWEQMEAHSLIMCLPNSGQPVTERSVFKIGYTDKHLYFAAYNYDREPEKIQSFSKIRDEMQLNNDWCGLMLDVYNDYENALTFFTSPAAVRLDMQILNDGEGVFPVNRDWNALWEVETKTTEEGWFAEFRIPLSTLRYQVKDDKVTMGLAAGRYVARYSEWYTYPEIPNQWGFWSWAKVSRYQKAEMTNVPPVNPLYFSPYILGGYQASSHLNDTESGYETENIWKRSIGMDVKYGLAKNLTLDLTINTDFAQVEADDQKINLTRYSLFFPEKRQFFMERANVFDFSLGEDGEFFYSRRIGLYEGQQVPVWGGGRITGRAGRWDLGAMSLQTGILESDQGEQLLGTENHSVLRMRRKMSLNKNSYIGFMGNSRIGRTGDYYAGLGVDAILNLKGDTYLKLAWAQTVDSSSSNILSLEQARNEVFLERRSYEGISYGISYERAGGEYRPDMGFEFRSDFTKLGHEIGYGIIAPRESPLARQIISLSGAYYFRNMDRSLETVEIIPYYTIITKNSADFTIYPMYTFDDVRNGFNLSSEIAIPAGQYHNALLSAEYGTSSEKMYYATIRAYTGSYYGGWRNSFSLYQILSLRNTWRFSLRYYLYRIDFKATEQLYLSHLTRFKLTYMYSTRLSASSYIQYNSLTDSFYINARIRYNPREGNDLYLVYNDAMNTSRQDYDPILPGSDLRVIMIKYTHTFRIR
ncbi:MAG: DUF5916 domain-containing protein [Bacteroidota bacterium]